MNRSRLIAGTALATGIAATAVLVASRTELFADRGAAQWSMLGRYCMDCHNAAEAEGNVVFEGLKPESVAQHAALFEKAARKLRGRLMPPPGNPQPGQADLDAFVGWLERSIDKGAGAHTAGHVPAQRLTRTEYAAAVKDLLAVDIDPAQYLPNEQEVDGFDKIAAALSVSPTFLEQYLGVARRVAHLAVGEPVPKLTSAYFPPPSGDQDGYVDGMPLGTRGGVKFTHDFLADGEYHVNITDLDVGLYPRSLETEHTLVMLLDRNEVFRAQLGGEEDLALVDRGGAPGRAEIMRRFADIPLEITAGTHELAITFIERSRASTDEPIFGFTPYGGFSFTGQMRAPRVIGGIEVKGPFGVTGLSSTASRQKIFVCTPENAAAERGCAERIAAKLARRAFRRPVDQSDIDRLMPFYENGRKAAGGFDAGIEQLVTAILASPDFLYRAITPPAGRSEQDTFALNDLELASRLSFFLWSQGPDEELLDLAAEGKLHDERVITQQVARMLEDARAESLVTDFALRWLNVDELDSVDPDDRLFPEWDDALRDDFAQEIELFVASVLLDGRNVQDLLTADYTFLNERLARHYGVPGVRGPQFRRVHLDDERRRGLLGKGAVLLRTSYGDRTSPVLRGAWVLDKLMGTPPTPPPPNVEHGSLDEARRETEDDPRSARAASSRRRLQRLSRRDRPLWLGAREFLRDGPVARSRSSSGAADRREHEAARRCADHGPRGAAPGAAEAPRPVRAGADAQAHDVCLGTRASVPRHAAGPGHRARRGEAQLHVRRARERCRARATRSGCRPHPSRSSKPAAAVTARNTTLNSALSTEQR